MPGWGSGSPLKFRPQSADLANRSLFHDRAGHALERVHRQGGRPAMLILDLHDFKIINDSLGHGAGDEFLVAVATSLAQNTPSGGTVARLGTARALSVRVP